MKVIFSDISWNQYHEWREADAAIFQRINALINEARRTPFSGTGKPEPLKNELSGWWSRRITGEHRLVYRVSGKGEAQAIEVASCRWHYR